MSWLKNSQGALKSPGLRRMIGWICIQKNPNPSSTGSR